MMRENLDQRRLLNRIEKSRFDRLSGHILYVKNPALRMSPFPSKIVFTGFRFGKLQPEIDKLLNLLRPGRDDFTNDGFIVKSVAGDQYVLDMTLYIIYIVIL